MTILNRPLDHINLNVPNMKEAVKFYTETMGFEVVNRFKQGMEFVFITDGNMTYELIENTQIQNAVIDHIAYTSEDIKADYEHFSKLGLTTGAMGYIDFLFENGVTYFFIRGVANEKIEFCQKGVFI